MILGFLGKGGSGKSSVSTQMALFLNDQKKSVLAIDADHNMDLSYNLTSGELLELKYFSQSLSTLQSAAGLSEGEKYDQAFLKNTDTRFSLSPLSNEIADYSRELENGIRLMAAGPQTDSVLYGTHCSHSLTTPLKILLPLLELQENETVIVDEKAGADGVSTGIVTGIDVGVIVCEPALHSVKTAKQIAELMNFYETPYIFVGNKVTSSEDKDFIDSKLGVEPAAFLMESTGLKRDPSSVVGEWANELQMISTKAIEVHKNNRLERTVKKFKRNREFAAV
ncbi:MAG: AAA family ATPase [Patescibacteria group bacterium]